MTRNSERGIRAGRSSGRDRRRGQPIRLWNVSARSEIAQLAGHRDAVTCVAFSADGETLASGGNDRMVRLWHCRTRRELGAFTFPREVTFVSFTRSGEWLLIGEGHRGPLHLWRTGRSHEGRRLTESTPTARSDRWAQLMLASQTNLAAHRRLPLAPTRDARLRPQLVDLSAQFNAGLRETWAVWDHANDLFALAAGVRRFGGAIEHLKPLVPPAAAWAGASQRDVPASPGATRPKILCNALRNSE